MVTGMRNLTVLGLIFICIPFAVYEFRLALDPQLEMAHQRVGSAQPQRVSGGRVEAARNRAQAAPGMAAPAAEMMMDDIQVEVADASAMVLKSAPQSAAESVARLEPAKAFALDPAAIIQTGPGLPQWQ